MAAGKRSPKRINATLLEAKAVELRLQGKTLAAIASQLGMSNASQAARVLDRGMAALGAPEKLEELKRLELARLDAINAELWERRGDPKAATSLVKVQERRARLCGLDAPIEVVNRTSLLEALRNATPQEIEAALAELGKDDGDAADAADGDEAGAAGVPDQAAD